MLELPETMTLSKQIAKTFRGKTITRVIANKSPHAMAWFTGDPQSYAVMLEGKRLESTVAVGGFVKAMCGTTAITFQDGIGLRAYQPGKPEPDRHQLYLQFDDGSALAAVVRMYGGIGVFEEGTNQNPYYLTACEKPSPLTDAFTEQYFASLFDYKGFAKHSAKAFLATEQRIPGLGNGVLQDILWRAKIHPKRKMGTLSDAQLSELYQAVREVLARMTEAGGRDTERDLFGNPGGYKTVLSANTVGTYCPACGENIKKEAYLGGSIYYCEGCQEKSV